VSSGAVTDSTASGGAAAPTEVEASATVAGQ
jgi:hypothetical protein